MKRDETDPLQWNLVAKQLAFWHGLPMSRMVEITAVGDNIWDVLLDGETEPRRVRLT